MKRPEKAGQKRNQVPLIGEEQPAPSLLSGLQKLQNRHAASLPEQSF